MLYQLPNGKTIDISIDEILNMTQERLQYYMSINAGISIASSNMNISNTEDEPNSNYDVDEFFNLYYPDDYEPDFTDDDHLDLDD